MLYSCREKIERTSGFKEAEQKRFALIQRMLEDARTSKAEVKCIMHPQ